MRTLLCKAIIATSLPLLATAKPLTSYAALGDSYASGNGAGTIEAIHCGRFSGAYPVQVAHNLVLALQNLACAGSFMSTVLYTQVPWIGNSDVVSVQVGGNEADFFSLLNECVHQWAPLSTCEHAIARAKSDIESDSFISNFDRLIAAIRHQAKPTATVLVLGYARFFNEHTEQCNHATFSKTDPLNFLIQARRKAFNEIITMLNVIIRTVADAHEATYVDIDPVFEGHRFCEQGILEPAQDASWFFNDISTAIEYSHILQREQVILKNNVNGFLDLTRTFHPTIEGHTAIADKIIKLLR